MKQYKILQHYVDKKNKKITYDFNYHWTSNLELIEKQKNEIIKDTKEVTFKNGYEIQYDSKQPYSIIEREIDKLEYEGTINYDYDYESDTIYIDNLNLVRELRNNVNGEKVKITIEILK